MHFRTYVLLASASLSLGGCFPREASLPDQRCDQLWEDLSCLYQDYEVPNELTLQDIIQIAMDKNLELDVRQREYAVQCEMANSERLKMIPELMASGHKYSRDRHTGSTSASLAVQPPAPPSISSESHTHRMDLTLTWNLLDFGISYYRSIAQAHGAVAFCYETERIRHELILHLVEEYWKAVVARRGIEKSERYLEEAEVFQGRIANLISASVIDERAGLTLQDELVDMKFRLGAYRRRFYEAKGNLLQGMGLAPNVDVVLAEPDWSAQSFDLGAIEDLEVYAASHRPELHGEDYSVSNTVHNARAELLSIYPNVGPYLAWDYDHNPFLIFNYWRTAGLQVSYDLLRIPQKIKAYKSAQRAVEARETSRLKTTLAVISQVHLSYIMYQESLIDYSIILERSQVKQDLALNYTKHGRAGVSHDLEVLLSQGDAIVAEIQGLEALGLVEAAKQRLKNSLGDPLMATPCDLAQLP